MSSEPPRRPPYQPPAGGAGGGGSYSYPSKPMKRPRDTGAGRDETADAEAAEAAANAPAPPNLRQLRGENARRWEEVVRLRGRLVQREAERRQATHGPVGDGFIYTYAECCCLRPVELRRFPKFQVHILKTDSVDRNLILNK